MILPPNSEIDFSPYRFVGRFRFNIAFALVFAIKPRMTLAPNSGSGISPSRFVGRVSFFFASASFENIVFALVFVQRMDAHRQRRTCRHCHVG